MPLDARLTTGASLALPLDVASLDQYRALAPNGVASTVLRRAAVVRTSGTAPDPVALLGLDPAVLPHLHRFRTDPSPATLADRLGRTPYPVQGARLPASATTLRLDATGTQNLIISAILARPDGVQGVIPVPGSIPEAYRGGTFVGLQIRETPTSISAILHHIGEGATEVEKRVVAVDLRSVVAEPGGPLPLDFTTWVAEDATIDLKDGALAIRSGLDGGSAIARASQPDRRADAAGDRRPGHGRRRERRRHRHRRRRRDRRCGAASSRRCRASRRPVTASSSPTRRRSRVCSTPGSRARARRARSGSAVAAPSARPCGRRRSTGSTSTCGPRTEARLVADPLARGAAALLLLAALAAAAVAVVAVALVVRSDLSSGADDLLTLEADGATPSSLRRLLAVRTGALVLIALVPGLLCGVILTRAVTRLVAVTATGAAPVPPLVAAGSAAAVIGVVAAIALLALLAVAVASALALREPFPPRPAGAGS